MIGSETADEGAALLCTAIGELAENAAADGIMLGRGDHTVWVVKAERLEEAGLDMAALARAMGVLAKRRDHE